MSSIDYVSNLSKPFLTVVAEPKRIATDAIAWQDVGLVVRAVRGRKCASLAALFDEFSAALQFPYYFGENWNAFGDCISDLSWLPIRRGIVVLIYGSEKVLADAQPGELATLVQILSSAAEEFSRVVEDGEWWDRGPVPFHVVLQGSAIDDFEEWRTAGAFLTPLT